MSLKVIEFAGLPGSGKSTLAAKVVSRLCVGDYAVISRHEALADEKAAPIRHCVRARYVLTSILRDPKPFLQALQLIYTDRQPDFRTFARVCWNMWCVLGWYGWLSRCVTGIAIVDQGLLQAIWSVRLSAIRDTADWSRFLRDLGTIGAVIIVDCHDDGLHQRLASRKQDSALSGVSVNDLIWTAGRHAFHKTLEDAAKIGPVLRLQNNNEQALDACLSKILDWREISET